MNRVLVDTSVVSYLFKGHSLAAHYREHMRNRLLAVSFMTRAELYRWPLERGWGEPRITSLLSHLSAYVVLPPDERMSWTWARIMSKKGRPIAVGDGWIAATAVRHDLPLVTHNPRNFQHVDGLSIITVPVG
jgi:tRNA(fMet)-specific endonuclease VapC